MALKDSTKIVRNILSAIDKKLDRYKIYVINAIKQYRIGPDQLQRGAVVGSKIAANSVHAAHIIANSIKSKHIETEAIEGRHLTLGAKASITTANHNLLLDSSGLVESAQHLIAEYEASELLPSTDYTIVLEGYVNEGQSVLVKFNDGAYGTDSASFDDDGIAIIRTKTPATLTNPKIRIYNDPNLSAIQAQIYWACIYKGFITSPPKEWTLSYEEVNERIDATQDAIGELVTTVSSKTTIFYQDSPPTTENVGDLWYNTDAVPVAISRWTGSMWTDITHNALAAALQAAADAQSTADGKIATFAQASEPADASVGDLWLDTDDNNKMHRWNGSSWVSVQDGTVSSLSAAITNLTSSLNTKTTIFYQDSQPTASATGDVWYDTDAVPVVIKRWSGSAWIDITTTALSQALLAASDAQSTADGKIITFAQTSAPIATAVGDLWVDTTDGKNILKRWNGSAWALVRDTSLDGRVQTIETNYDGLTGAMETIARQTAYTGSLPPETPTDYASWINTGVVPPEQLRWTGNSVNKARSYPASKSGAAVVINDLSDDRALNVTVKTVASQAGSGIPSPSNIRPIVGINSVVVNLYGKNLLNKAKDATYTGGAALSELPTGVRATATAAGSTPFAYVDIGPLGAFLGKSLTLNFSPTASAANIARAAIAYTNDAYSSRTIAANDAVGPVTLSVPATVPEGMTRLAVVFYANNGGTVAVGDYVDYSNAQLEVAASPSAYADYAGRDYILTIPNPAYGLPGGEDLVRSVGNVDYNTAITTLVGGSESWGNTNEVPGTGYCALTHELAGMHTDFMGLLCSHFPYVQYAPGSTTESISATSNSAQIVVCIALSRLAVYGATSDRATHPAAFKLWLAAQNTANTPLQILYRLATNGYATFTPVKINGVDGVNILTSDGAVIVVDYTGSGWQVISGKANSLYASANMKFDVNGLEITQTSLSGNPVGTKFAANSEKYGIFRSSDGKMLQGARSVRGGRVLGVTSALADPDSDGNAYVDVITSSTGSKTALRLMGVSFEGAVDPPGTPPGDIPTMEPNQTGNVAGIEIGFDTMCAWDGTTYADEIYGHLDAKGDFELHADRSLKLSGGADIGVNIESGSMVYGGVDNLGNTVIDYDFTWQPFKTNSQHIGSPTFRIRKIYSQSALDTPSDERFKRDMSPLERAVDFIMGLNPISYRYDSDEPDAPLRMGVTAQRTIEALNAAGMGEYAVVNRSNPDELSMVYTELIAPLIATVQYQQRRIEALDSDISKFYDLEASLFEYEVEIQEQKDTILEQEEKIESLEKRLSALEELLLSE